MWVKFDKKSCTCYNGHIKILNNSKLTKIKTPLLKILKEGKPKCASRKKKKRKK